MAKGGSLSQRIPAHPGDAAQAIETPALVLDLDAFERNLDAMAREAAAAGIRLRPHAKSHKCVDVAREQLARGAVGICCQKTDEALAFVEGGIGDVLVTNEVVDPRKLARLADAARTSRIGLLVDHPLGIRRASDAARAAGSTLDVYVEVDVGSHRCGVAPDAGGELAAQVARSHGLRFAGLHCYHGSAQHLRKPAERAAAIDSARALAVRAKQAVEARGVPCPIVTGAGTGTFRLERDSGVWNELQPGSYPFMDADYARNEGEPGAPGFEHALFVLASVTSAPAPTRSICDAGLKAFAFDAGLPLVHGRDGVRYAKASDEHGVLVADDGARAPALGDLVQIVPGHVDPTINLYDWIVGVRGGRVECVWSVAARGALG
jgi:D-serine deaminase-like pyridoxal phosphate-dependent protein